MFEKSWEKSVNSPQHKKSSRILPYILLYCFSPLPPYPSQYTVLVEMKHNVAIKRFIHMLFLARFEVIRMISDGGDYRSKIDNF